MSRGRRRAFLRAAAACAVRIVALVVLGSVAGPVPAAAVPAASAQPAGGSCGDGGLVYFGTRTGAAAATSTSAKDARETSAFGIFAARFDARSGALTGLGGVAAVERPTWIVVHPKLPLLYSVSEIADGAVVSLAVDPSTGSLRETGRAASGGGGPTYLALDATARTLLVANYGTGQVSALPLAPDGNPGSPVSVRRDYGFGPGPRQASPHAHQVVLDPSGRFVLVPDLGADRIFAYRLDPTGQLQAVDPAYQPLSGGAGPRHLVFHPNGRFVVVLTELSAQLLLYRWDSRSGALHPLQTLSSVAPEFQGRRSAAEISMSADGRFVYVSNRGEDTLVVYSMDAITGRLSEVQRTASLGHTPWSFALDPQGRWMLVANEGSDSINVLAVDPVTGLLRGTPHTLTVPHPVSVTFFCG